jgi:NhaP-type Na+/H+ or K+/H+ antiporter
MTRATLFQPAFSAILHDRRLSSLISGVALLQLLLTLIRFPSWPCPVFHTLGVPCPGCGMTRATLFLVHGEWRQALLMHAFAPIAVLALALIAFCTIAPKPHAEWIADRAEIVERYTGLTTLLLGGLILYWLARLLILQSAFVRLIR